MSSPPTPPAPGSPSGAVFVSYASQDAEAARRICDALRAVGVEVWFDQNELTGGDAWDAKIRKHIAECALFVPVISAATQARREGYFRIEWKLAAQRTHAMADGTPFLLPVLIDETRDAEALVPAEFKAVQWTRLPGGETPEKFCARVRRVLQGAVECAAVPAALPAAVSWTEPRRSLRWSAMVAALLALVGAGWWLTAKRPAHTPMTNSAAAEPAGDVPRLVERARQLRALSDLTRERLGAAEELLKEAAKLSPTDPDVLAMYAQVDALMSYRSWDRSDERRQAAGQRAARAVALAPGGFEPRRAQAMVAAFMLQSPEALQEAEATYRRLSEERPGDANVLEELGTILLWQGQPREAARVFTQAGRRLLAATAHMWAGQARQARDETVALLAERRSVGALVLKANVDLFSFNDREAAKASVSQLTPTELREDDAAGIALRLAVLSADAPGLLKLMEQFPHPFISILGINYPRRYWMGMARDWLKQPDAARIEWRAALQTIEERLKANPADHDALSWAALLHMCLGDTVATEQALRLYRNYRDLSDGYWDFHYCLPLLRVPGREDEAIDRLAKTLREPPNGQFNNVVYAWARFSPEFDPLRGKPRFEQLLREVRPADALPFADERAAATAAAPDKSVAVLAFKNLSGDPAREFFSDALSETVTDVLGRVPGLKVVGSTSAFSFKGKSVAIPEMARQLGVTHLVEGTVLQEGQTVRITAKLIQADGFQAWVSDKLDRESKNIFALLDEVAGLITKSLSLKLGTSSAPSTAAVNPQAFELYIQARQAWGLRTTEGFAQAEQLLTRALDLEPNFARAHAALADVWITSAGAAASVGHFRLRGSATIQKSRAAARRAIDLDSNLAEAHAALGNIAWTDWQIAEAIPALRTAVTLNSNYASAHQFLGRVLATDGRMEQALAELRRAHELEPLAHKIADNLGIVLFSAGRYTEALALADRALALQPSSIWAWSIRGWALAELGQADAAVTAVWRVVGETPATWKANAAYALARAGARSQAQAMLDRIEPADRSANAAAALLVLGQNDECWRALEEGSRNIFSADAMLFWPGFDSIRGEARFQKMLATLGLTEAHARAQAWRAAHPPEKAPAK